MGKGGQLWTGWSVFQDLVVDLPSPRELHHWLGTIGLDLPLSVRSQSLTDESEVGEEPFKPDRTR
jgi:hypothetical protein